MGDDVGSGPPSKGLDVSVLEAAEISAWRADKARRLPRRARIWALRLAVLCVGSIVVLGVLGEVVTFVTTTIVHSIWAAAPRQK